MSDSEQEERSAMPEAYAKRSASHRRAAATKLSPAELLEAAEQKRSFDAGEKGHKTPFPTIETRASKEKKLKAEWRLLQANVCRAQIPHAKFKEIRNTDKGAVYAGMTAKQRYEHDNRLIRNIKRRNAQRERRANTPKIVEREKNAAAEARYRARNRDDLRAKSAIRHAANYIDEVGPSEFKNRGTRMMPLRKPEEYQEPGEGVRVLFDAADLAKAVWDTYLPYCP
ncbi:hypothetical protein CYLTODRAFT_477309 [Cylindrobasidium torrendii FP15055 ss-10]|uniref:Uncharacterized protein n=1 Tax=Cylindrobasidium torrendii FP15055 ss-10 TaxID=1314674 RepID=A0A0D7ATT7_9AGAR|nr:hypothetical protein CYLTODRAFT_477309 [Cylindrobasidium torrendii FP15055 ss-10]